MDDQSANDQSAESASRVEQGAPARGGARGRLTGFVMLALAAALATWWLSDERKAISAPPVPAAAPLPLQAVTVSKPLVRDLVEWSSFTGQFTAVESVELRARVSGYLTEIHFADGDTVKKGDLLFVIDPRPFEADLQAAAAVLDRDRAQVVRTTLDLKRYAELVTKSFATQQQYEQARAAADAATATVRADEAALAQARLNLEFTKIKAPVSGRIGRHQVSIGNLVIGGANPTTTLLATIVSLDPIQFEFDVSEAQQLAYKRGIAAGQLTAGETGKVPVQARLADERRWAHDGRIDFVDNQFNRESGTLRLRAVFANPDLLLVPGAFARVRLASAPSHQAVLVPDRAVLTDQTRQMVMTVNAEGTVVPRPIQAGPSYQGLRIIRSGLGPEDLVIIDGLMRARPGVKVAPQPGRIEPDPEAD